MFSSFMTRISVEERRGGKTGKDEPNCDILLLFSKASIHKTSFIQKTPNSVHFLLSVQRRSSWQYCFRVCYVYLSHSRWTLSRRATGVIYIQLSLERTFLILRDVTRSRGCVQHISVMISTYRMEQGTSHRRRCINSNKATIPWRHLQARHKLGPAPRLN